MIGSLFGESSSGRDFAALVQRPFNPPIDRRQSIPSDPGCSEGKQQKSMAVPHRRAAAQRAQRPIYRSLRRPACADPHSPCAPAHSRSARSVWRRLGPKESPVTLRPPETTPPAPKGRTARPFGRCQSCSIQSAKPARWTRAIVGLEPLCNIVRSVLAYIDDTPACPFNLLMSRKAWSASARWRYPCGGRVTSLGKI